MATKIKLKRGEEANLPALDVGEPAFTTDTKKFFIGSDVGNHEFGAKGDKGDSLTTYDHHQMIAASVWTIVHNMDRNPSVSVVDSGGSMVSGDVVYIDTNTIQITFSSGFGGTAFLN